MANLYAFVDESGNDDFSPKGTKFWLVTSMVLYSPETARQDLHDLLQTVRAEGLPLPEFKASEDKQHVRDRVFRVLGGLHRAECRVDAVILEKSKAHPKLRVPERYYCESIDRTLKYQFDPRGVDATRYDKVVVIVDRPAKRGQAFESINTALHTSLPRYLRGVPYELVFEDSRNHHGLQMVDYLGWAIMRKWERNDLRSHQLIQHLVAGEFDLLRAGTIHYWKTT